MEKRQQRFLVAGLLGAVLAVLGLYLSRGLVAYKTNTTNSPVRLNELMASNSSYPDGMGGTADWIELYNASEQATDISGYMLTDHNRKARYIFPADTLIPGNGYLVVYCKKDGGGSYADFSLAKLGGETLLLLNRRSDTVDGVMTASLKTDQAMAYDGTAWMLVDDATPGFVNNAMGRKAYLAAQQTGSVTVRINEMQSRNDAIADGHNRFTDWIELYNYGGETCDLSGFRLTDRASKKGYVFPVGTVLPAGKFLVVHCMSDPTEPDYAPFALSGDGGESVYLENASGLVLDRADTQSLAKNESMALDEKGVWTVSAGPTPGYPNTQAGYEAYFAVSSSPLVLNEAMPGNAALLRQADGACYDWVELKNVSDAPVNLGEYWLSDSERELLRCQLPERTLMPGEFLVLLCTGNSVLTKTKYETLPLTLSAAGETVYLTDARGAVADSLPLYGLSYNGSRGREANAAGFFLLCRSKPRTGE